MDHIFKYEEKIIISFQPLINVYLSWAVFGVWTDISHQHLFFAQCNVLYMVRKLMMWGLISCLEHFISMISQRLRFAMTRWDNFDSYTWTLVLCKYNSLKTKKAEKLWSGVRNHENFTLTFNPMKAMSPGGYISLFLLNINHRYLNVRSVLI